MTKTKSSNRAFTSSREMINHGADLIATSTIPYLAKRQFESAVYFMAGNVNTVQDIRKRKTLSPKQEEFVERLEAEMPNMTSYVAYTYDQAERAGADTSEWMETANRSIGLKTESELESDAEKRYEMLPADQSAVLTQRFVEKRLAKQDALAVGVYKSVELALKEGGDQPWDLNPRLTRVILQNFLRYAEDNSDVERIEERAEENGLADDTVDELIAMAPVMEHAVFGLNDMIAMLDEHIERAGNDPFNGMH